MSKARRGTPQHKPEGRVRRRWRFRVRPRFDERLGGTIGGWGMGTRELVRLHRDAPLTRRGKIVWWSIGAVVFGLGVTAIVLSAR